jgi:hypothetical protein
MSNAATHRHVEKPRKPAATHEEMEMAERDDVEGPLTTYLEEHEWPRLTAGITVAAGVGLLAVSFIGVGPAAIAGAAGYVAYRELSGKRSKATSESGGKR